MSDIEFAPSKPAPVPVIVDLTPAEVRWCREATRLRVGEDEAKNTTPESGYSLFKTDLIGVMAEYAVCLKYGLDPESEISRTPGVYGDGGVDLVIEGYEISVKGRERFERPLEFWVPAYNKWCDIYIFCSVNIAEGVVWLRGWKTRPEIARIGLSPWKWTDNRPGAEMGRQYRFIPVEDLRVCRPKAIASDSKTPERARNISPESEREPTEVPSEQMMPEYWDQVIEKILGPAEMWGMR